MVPRPAAISITWKLVRNANSRALPTHTPAKSEAGGGGGGGGAGTHPSGDSKVQESWRTAFQLQKGWGRGLGTHGLPRTSSHLCTMGSTLHLQRESGGNKQLHTSPFHRSPLHPGRSRSSHHHKAPDTRAEQPEDSSHPPHTSTGNTPALSSGSPTRTWLPGASRQRALVPAVRLWGPWARKESPPPSPGVLRRV